MQADLETFFKYDREDTQLGSYEELVVPCPYITMIYHTSNSIVIDGGVYVRGSLLNADAKVDGEEEDNESELSAQQARQDTKGA